MEKMGLKKAVDPVEQAKEWQRKIKHESRQADREIREFEREEQKFIKEIQKVAKMGDRGGSAVKVSAGLDWSKICDETSEFEDF